jgi:hypothetical protein
MSIRMNQGKIVSSHPRPVLLQALADGEIDTRRRAALEAHVASCARCRDQMEELRALSRGFALAVRQMDATGEKALARLAAIPPAPVQARPIGGTRVWLRAASVAVLLVGTAAVAGLAGLWLRERLVGPPPIAEAPLATLTERPMRETGITVAAGSGAFELDLTGLTASSRIELAVVDNDSVSIYVRSDDARVRFSQDGSGLDAVISGRADVLVILPRSLSAATITVDGEVRARKIGSEVEVPTVPSSNVIVQLRSGG